MDREKHDWGAAIGAVIAAALVLLCSILSLRGCAEAMVETERVASRRHAAFLDDCRRREHEFKAQCIRDGNSLTDCRVFWVTIEGRCP